MGIWTYVGFRDIGIYGDKKTCIMAYRGIQGCMKDLGLTGLECLGLGVKA